MVFAKIDKSIMRDDLILIEMYKDKGAFIKIDRDVKQFSIEGKLRLIKYISNILVKRCQKIPY